jgi:hypothetical protein
MTELHLSLTAEEHDYLIGFLEMELKERLVEEHRTRTPSYREHVLRQERLIESLLRKLSPSSVPS